MSFATNIFLKLLRPENPGPPSMLVDPMFTFHTVKKDMEEMRKMRTDSIAGVDADDLAAQMDAIIARAEARL